MSDFRKLGPAVVDADRVRGIFPADEGYPEPGVWVNYADDKVDFVKTETPEEAITEFYTPNPLKWVAIRQNGQNVMTLVYEQDIPPKEVENEAQSVSFEGYSGFSGDKERDPALLKLAALKDGWQVKK